MFTAEPLAVLNHAAGKLAGIWRAISGEEECRKKEDLGQPWGGGESLPRLIVKRILQASKTFPKNTSHTYDGLHHRHFSILPYKALLAVSMLLEAVECLGVMPDANQHTMISLIPKPKGF